MKKLRNSMCFVLLVVTFTMGIRTVSANNTEEIRVTHGYNGLIDFDRKIETVELGVEYKLSDFAQTEYDGKTHIPGQYEVSAFHKAITARFNYWIFDTNTNQYIEFANIQHMLPINTTITLSDYVEQEAWKNEEHNVILDSHDNPTDTVTITADSTLSVNYYLSGAFPKVLDERIKYLATNDSEIDWKNDRISGEELENASYTFQPDYNYSLNIVYFNAFPVTYDANGGKGTVVDSTTYRKDGAVILKEASSLTREGYTFIGWNTQADGKGVMYQPGQTLAMVEDLTFYAQWSKNTTKASFTNVPKTGDATSISLWGVGMIVSSVVGLSINKKRKMRSN